MAEGRCVNTLEGHGGAVLALAILGHGRLASASADHSRALSLSSSGRCSPALGDPYLAAQLRIADLPTTAAVEDTLGPVPSPPILLAAHANVHSSMDVGSCDLFPSRFYGHTEVAKILIAANANVDTAID